MSATLALAAVEARLLVRDSTALLFAFAFPPFVAVILAGVFGSQPDEGFGMRPPDDYYVVASLGIPILAVALVGLPVALAAYRERGVLRRFEAFGVSAARVFAAQAAVACVLILLGAAVELAVAAPIYGVPAVVHPGRVVLGLAVATLALLACGLALGLAAPSARAAQALGLCAFFPVYLLGGGGPPRGVMSGAMRSLSDLLPSPLTAIADPWLGAGGLGRQLAVLGCWALAAAAAVAWLRRGRRLG